MKDLAVTSLLSPLVITFSAFKSFSAKKTLEVGRGEG